MATKTYVCLRWEGDDDDYNHVAFTDVANPTDLTPAECVGNIMDILWGDDLHKALILGQGKKKSMKRMQHENIQKALDRSILRSQNDEHKSKAAKRKIKRKHPYGEDFVDPDTVIRGKRRKNEKRCSSGPPPAGNICDTTDFEPDIDENRAAEGLVATTAENGNSERDGDGVRVHRNAEADKDKLIYDLKKRVAFYEGTASMKAKHHRIGPLAGTEDIGNGVEVEKSLLVATLVTCQGSPQLYLRSLVFNSGAFSLEEIAESSVTGRADPRNPKVHRPALDPIKLNALKAHTIKTFKLNPDDKEYENINRAVKNFPGDARARLKRIAAKKSRVPA